MIRRRQFIKISGTLATAMACRPALSLASQLSVPERGSLPKPTPAQMRWQDCEVGVIYHFDLPLAAHQFPTGPLPRKKTFDPDLYQPTKLDTDQWIEAAKAAGARYAIFTATAGHGFLQWQSDLYPYSLKQTSWRDGKGDVVADFIESCRKADILPGLYLSIYRNTYWNAWYHYVNWGEGRGTEKQAAYNRMAEKKTEELCSRYGPLVQIWYDVGVKTPEEGGPDVLPIFEKHQPASVFYHNKDRSDHRWVGNENGYADYPCWAAMPVSEEGVSHNVPSWKPILDSGDPDGQVWSPAMVDVPLRGANGVHSWMWKPDQEHGIHSKEALVEMYYNSVGRNGNFVVGAVVTPEGLVPEPDIKRLEEYGSEIRRRFDRPVAETSGCGRLVELRLRKPGKIDHVMVMEDIAHGELIREYSVEGLVDGGKWEQLAEGQCIGHKRIQPVGRREVAAVRLRSKRTVAEPHIRRLAVFDTASS